MTAAPQNEGPNCFLAVHDNRCRHRWVASARHVCFLINRENGYLAGPMEDFLTCTPLVADYPPVIHVSHIGAIEFLFWNADQSTRFLKVSDDQVERASIELPMHTLTAWTTEEKIYVAGMRHRHRQESKTGFQLRKGLACIAEFDVASKTHTVRDYDLGKFPHQEDSAAAKMADPLTEAWLGSLLIAGERMLIGAIIEGAPREEDWTIFDVPNWSDFDILGLYRHHAIEEGPIKLWHPYSFVQNVETPDATLVYMLGRADASSLRIDALACVTFGNTGPDAPDMQPEPITIQGLDTTLTLGRFSVAHDPSVGFYGLVGILGKHATVRSILIMSPDGIHWKVVQAL